MSNVNYIINTLTTGAECIRLYMFLFIFSHFILIFNRFSQGLQLRQIDMLQDDVAGSSRTLSTISQKLRKVCKSAIRRRERRGKQRLGHVEGIHHCNHRKWLCPFLCEPQPFICEPQPFICEPTPKTLSGLGQLTSHRSGDCEETAQ